VKRRRRGWSPDNHAYQHRSPDPTKIERATATSTAALFFLFLRTLTIWSLSRNWVLILKELRSLPPSSMCTLGTLLLNLSIPDMPFPVILSTLVRSRFQSKPATTWSPFSFLFAVEELYGTRYQSGSFSLINVGSSGFHCCVIFVLFFSFSIMPSLVSSW